MRVYISSSVFEVLRAFSVSSCRFIKMLTIIPKINHWKTRVEPSKICARSGASNIARKSCPKNSVCQAISMSQLITPMSPASTITQYVRFTDLSLMIRAILYKWMSEPLRMTSMLLYTGRIKGNISFSVAWHPVNNL